MTSPPTIILALLLMGFPTPNQTETVGTICARGFTDDNENGIRDGRETAYLAQS